MHTFITSNELNPDYFVDTADMLFDLALEIKDKLRIRIGFVNISGGIGIPYQPDQKKVNLAYVGEGIRKKYQEKIRNKGLHWTLINLNNLKYNKRGRSHNVSMDPSRMGRAGHRGIGATLRASPTAKGNKACICSSEWGIILQRVIKEDLTNET